jgi:hypothetical protein
MQGGLRPSAAAIKAVYVVIARVGPCLFLLTNEAILLRVCPLLADFVAEVAEREACRASAPSWSLKLPFAPLERWL